MSMAELECDEIEDRQTDYMLGADGCDGLCHYDGECDQCSSCQKMVAYNEG